MRIFLLAVVCTLLAGCFSSPTPTSHYLLRSDATSLTGDTVSDAEVVLVSVDVATYINQDRLVMELENGEIYIAEYHRWAEPLRHSLMKFLANEVAASSGKMVHSGTEGSGAEQTRLMVDIDQLHGNNQGEAVLDAYWQIVRVIDGERVREDHRWSATQAMSDDGYAMLVEAEKMLLGQLAKEIAGTL
ncbi:PqiC family protein [Aestuariirhabdus sp. Z084]|uniref:PqiC family protein n=1 Tax=Aestuariirhabdus haliotis TaxID=2918751 RepID=UPI00201B4361|nr:PqiC family protein [Aestuariirhabdus haliotis]MCL6415349.1 PqiC family protein [Aestuariirhabdus haliotis]MCL6419105.1 PqiC family protein [Aestuariirhabdus haliotis]